MPEIDGGSIRDMALRNPRGPFVRRWVAGLLDLLAVGFMVLTANRLLPSEAHAGNPSLGASIALVLGIAYYWLPEALWGRTLGKQLLGLRIVDDSGRNPGALKAMIRTLLRFLGVNPFLFGGLPAAIVAYRSKAGQRLGDLLARTYVLPVADLARRPGSTTVDRADPAAPVRPDPSPGLPE